jgi:hypothetical protein
MSKNCLNCGNFDGKLFCAVRCQDYESWTPEKITVNVCCKTCYYVALHWQDKPCSGCVLYSEYMRVIQ